MISSSSKSLRLVMLSVSLSALGSVSHAALVINGKEIVNPVSAKPVIAKPANVNRTVDTSQSRIGWGDGLENAKSIMYNRSVLNSKQKLSEINSARQTTNNYNVGKSNGVFNSSKSIGRSNTGSLSNGFYKSPYSNTHSLYERLAINTNSQGAIVLDLKTGKSLYEKNANRSRAIASITKLMTAMVVLDAGTDMRTEIRLTPEDFRCSHSTCRSSSSKLRVGDRLNRSELLLMMLMKSENPSAKSLSRHYLGGYTAFMKAMNLKARSLGMNDTFFGDPSGLDTRNVASPNDLVKMIKEARKYPIISRYSTTPSYNFSISNATSGNRVYKARNTSYIVRNRQYPLGISKTGHIKKAGMCVVMETRINNRPAIVVLLGANSYAKRNKDANKILASLSSRF